jgi:hypothetical protein
MQISGQETRTTGRFIRAALLDGGGYLFLQDPQVSLWESKECRTRIKPYTFIQPSSERSRKYSYPMKWDKAAAVSISSVDHWLKHQVNDEARNKARMTEKNRVVTREVRFDDNVTSGIQTIYNETLEDISGYVPIRRGGINWVAVMKGWLQLSAQFHYGKKEYFLGGHPLCQLLRDTLQFANKPYVVGGIGSLAAYFWCWVTRTEQLVSSELMRLHGPEQLAKLCELLPMCGGVPRTVAVCTDDR